jgi:hypothetical protein
MAILTQIKRPLKLKMPYNETFVIVRVFNTAITDGVTTTSDPDGSLAIDTTVPSLFIADGGVWVALATQTATPSFTSLTVTTTSDLVGLVTAEAGVVGPLPVETVAATNVITAAESGKVFFLSSATEFASTLPAPAAGLHYTFIVAAAPSGADYTVVTDAGAQILAGKVFSAAGDAGDVENAATATTISFVSAQSVIGDIAEVWSDGTSWFAICHASVAAGITITG